MARIFSGMGGRHGLPELISFPNVELRAEAEATTRDLPISYPFLFSWLQYW